jgi:hypothetical protein
MTTKRDTYLALALRCEQEEPSRELDARIGLARGGVADFTSSLDAAVALIGDEWSLKVSAWDNGYLGGHAWLMAPSSTYASDMKIWGEGHVARQPTDKTYSDAHAAFPRAICAAFFRALAAMEVKP